MMATDPSILFQSNPAVSNAGMMNDPQRLAQSQSDQLKAMQDQRAWQSQNMLRKLVAAPGALKPDGTLAPEVVGAVMKFDPVTGFQLQKHNQDTQMAQFEMQAKQSAAQLAKSEVGQMALGFTSDAYAQSVQTFDQAKKDGRSDQEANGAAAKAFQDAISLNGGQLSEDAEKQILSHPYELAKARVLAGYSKTYTDAGKAAQEQADKDRTFALDVSKEEREEREEKATETYQTGLLRNARAKLEGAGGGGANFSTVADYSQAIQAAEGGITGPRGPGTSSAQGAGQFVNATFRKYIGKVDPAVAKQVAGMNDAQLSAYRKAHPELDADTTKMTDVLTQENIEGLQSHGLDVTPGSVYLAHMLGIGGPKEAGATQVLSADDATAVKDVLPAKVLAANPQLGRMTVGDLKDWAESRMTKAAGSLAGPDHPDAFVPGTGMSWNAIHDAAMNAISQGQTAPPARGFDVQGRRAIGNEIGRLMKVNNWSVNDVVSYGAQLTAAKRALVDTQKATSITSRLEAGASRNLNLVLQTARKLGISTLIPLNKLSNTVLRNTGNTDISQLQAAITSFNGQYSQIMGGGGVSTDALRAKADAMLNTGMSLAQIEKTMATMQTEMANRSAGNVQTLADLQDQIKNTKIGQPNTANTDTGVPVNAPPLLAKNNPGDEALFAKYGIK